MDAGGSVEEQTRGLVVPGLPDRTEPVLDAGSLPSDAAVGAGELQSVQQDSCVHDTYWGRGRREGLLSAPIRPSPPDPLRSPIDPPQLAERGLFAVVDAFDPVTQGLLGHPQILDQPLEAPRLDRGRLA